MAGLHTHWEEALKHKAQAGFACKAEHVTAVEFNLCSNPVSAFISWVKRKEIGDFCSLILCDVTEGFLSLLPSLPPPGPSLSCLLPPFVRALSAQPLLLQAEPSVLAALLKAHCTWQAQHSFTSKKLQWLLLVFGPWGDKRWEGTRPVFLWTVSMSEELVKDDNKNFIWKKLCIENIQ